MNLSSTIDEKDIEIKNLQKSIGNHDNSKALIALQKTCNELTM